MHFHVSSFRYDHDFHIPVRCLPGHGLPPGSWHAIPTARLGAIEGHGLTVMSTSFLSSTLLDAGSVVWFMEAHPAKNATQIRHAIHFLIFITEHLLPSAGI
jgi:hypothetical protein